ncbi:hypothetical protein [Microlunatus sp. GCM10028923]|uniref:hypothetical protein n=1 Tax=Microlunatus sp. GCM10028923 TaxID=3273400 RepID=UPI00361F6862
MTEAHHDQNARPRTDVEEIDAALTELDGLADQPVAEHHDRLARVHEALHTALHEPSEQHRPADSTADVPS